MVLRFLPMRRGMDGWMDGWTYGWVDRWMNISMYVYKQEVGRGRERRGRSRGRGEGRKGCLVGTEAQQLPRKAAMLQERPKSWGPFT